MNPVDLPPQRAAVLAFLRRELAAGRAPSLADIAGAFGFASRNAAQKHVQALVADGLLEQAPGQKRGLRGGPETLDSARSAYVRTEWSGAYDRRARRGGSTKTEI